MVLLAAAQRRAGIRATVCALTGPVTLATDLTTRGVPFEVLGRNRLNDPRLVFDLVRRLRRARPDLVHTHLFYADITGRLAAPRYPAVVSTETSPKAHGHAAAASDGWTPSTRRIVAVSEGSGSTHPARLPAAISKHPNGIEPSWTRAARSRHPIGRARSRSGSAPRATRLSQGSTSSSKPSLVWRIPVCTSCSQATDRGARSWKRWRERAASIPSIGAVGAPTCPDSWPPWMCWRCRRVGKGIR